MASPVTRYYLEMTSPDDLRPAKTAEREVELRQITEPNPELNLYFYATVGGNHHWIDRRIWTRQQWMKYLCQPQIETWVLYVGGTPAGYFELEAQSGGNVKIAYFGLVPKFIGRGLGSHLLTMATKRAWQKGACRVWIHTSTQDHLHALSNYLGRGFRVFKKEALS